MQAAKICTWRKAAVSSYLAMASLAKLTELLSHWAIRSMYAALWVAESKLQQTDSWRLPPRRQQAACR